MNRSYLSARSANSFLCAKGSDQIYRNTHAAFDAQSGLVDIRNNNDVDVEWHGPIFTKSAAPGTGRWKCHSSPAPLEFRVELCGHSHRAKSSLKSSLLPSPRRNRFVCMMSVSKRPDKEQTIFGAMVPGGPLLLFLKNSVVKIIFGSLLREEKCRAKSTIGFRRRQVRTPKHRLQVRSNHGRDRSTPGSSFLANAKRRL